MKTSFSYFIILSVIGLFITYSVAAQDVKISELRTFNGNPKGGWVPISVSGVTKKVDGRWFGYDNVDSVWIQSDTLNYRLKGGAIFSLKIPIISVGIKFKTVDTYALMIADGTPANATFYEVISDEKLSYTRSTYLWKPNGHRELIPSTPDN